MYRTVDRFSDSSSIVLDETDEKSFAEKYHENFESSEKTSSNNILRRWLTAVIDIPNNLTNRLREWLRTTNDSPITTIDKCSGTNSFDKIEIQTYELFDNDDYSQRDKFDNFVKRERKRRNDRNENNSNATNDDCRRYVKNHHVYHVYKQNETGIERVVGGRRNYSTSWLQRNGPFTSDPILVLPRIDPDTGLPIIHPRNSRTTIQRRPPTYRKKNLPVDRGDGEIWDFEENGCDQRRDDNGRIGKTILERRIVDKSQISLRKNSGNNVDRDGDRENDFEEFEATSEFRETISMRVELEQPRTMSETTRTKNLKIHNTESREFDDVAKLSAVARKNVDALLNDLRNKINCTNAKKKGNGPIERPPEIKSQNRDRSYVSDWRNKFASIDEKVEPALAEARASFAERIQDLWIGNNNSCRWTVINDGEKMINDDGNGIKNNDDDEEKKIIFRESTIDEIRKNGRILKVSATQSSFSYKMEKPTVCDVGAQYSILDTRDVGESRESFFSWNIPGLKNHEDRLKIKISEVSTVGTEPNVTSRHFGRIPSSRKVNVENYVQCEIFKASKHIASSQSTIIRDKKTSDEMIESFIEDNIPKKHSIEKMLSTLNINSKASLFESPSRKIGFSVKETTSKIIPTEKFRPTNENDVKNIPTRENVSSKNSQFSAEPKKRRCPFRRLRKIRHKPPMRLKRSKLINSKKFRPLKCRIPKIVRPWLTDKFNSKIRRRRSSVHVDGEPNFPSKNTTERTFAVRNIFFKCIKKMSKKNISKQSLKDEYSISKTSESKRDSMGSTIRKKIEDKKFERDNGEVGLENDENDGKPMDNDNSAHFGGIKSAVGDNRWTTSGDPITTLSVTTSNSSNIPLQLLGSTSDTNVVPSNRSQDASDGRADESKSSIGITTPNEEIETCEETDHYRPDSFPSPDDSFRVDDESNEREITENDTKKSKNCSINEIEKKNESNEKLGISNKTHNLQKFKKKQHYELKTGEIMKDDVKRTNNRFINDIEKKYEFNDKLGISNATKNKHKSKKPITIAQKRKIDDKSRIKNVVSDENISIKSVNFSDKREKKLVTTKTNIFDDDDEKNVEKMELKRRTSRMDIVVDKSTREESSRAEIRSAHNDRRLERRKSVVNIRADDSSNKADEKKSNERRKSSDGRKDTSIKLDSSLGTRKLRRRADSPMIPRRSTDLHRKNLTSGKTSLIPIGIGTIRINSNPTKTVENNYSPNRSKSPNLNVNENKISTTKSIPLEARSSLKKSLKNSSDAGSKKMSTCRVRFELENEFSKKPQLKANEDGKKKLSEHFFRRPSGIRSEIDDERFFQRVRSSMKNGSPLKTIRIIDPCSLSERTDEAGASKFEVEKSVTGQTRESSSDSRKLGRSQRTRPISRGDSGIVNQPRGQSSVAKKIPIAGDSFEKRHLDDRKISYRSILTENNEIDDATTCSIERCDVDMSGFPESEKTGNSDRRSIIDLTRIKEQVENEILEQTARSCGTEDCDCAIVLIKAINSSMELSDA